MCIATCYKTRELIKFIIIWASQFSLFYWPRCWPQCPFIFIAFFGIKLFWPTGKIIILIFCFRNHVYYAQKGCFVVKKSSNHEKDNKHIVNIVVNAIRGEILILKEKWNNWFWPKISSGLKFQSLSNRLLQFKSSW